MSRFDDLLHDIKIDFHRRSVEDAYQLASELARDWGMRTDRLDEWIDAYRAGDWDADDGAVPPAGANQPGDGDPDA